jgi:hypothetical protein
VCQESHDEDQPAHPGRRWRVWQKSQVASRGLLGFQGPATAEQLRGALELGHSVAANLLEA